jgi:hypothetical protein
MTDVPDARKGFKQHCDTKQLAAANNTILRMGHSLPVAD